ncbi:FmdB family zinc ribbon protein [Phototrophicus methaneseepsis]
MYRCQACQTHFEVRKPMAEVDTDAECPECHSLETRRLISTVAVFSSSSNGQPRALAGASPCSACSAAGPACASCHPR